jgi:L-ascorbate metabolism protein UlaG (beta-lactamase superfamily)
MAHLRALLIALLTAGCCEFSGPRWHGRVTDHFDGRHFHNQVPGETRFRELVAWRTHRLPGRWPAFVDVPPAPPPPRRVGMGELRVTFVNHATVLIQMDGVNILTDPIWGDVAGPVPYIARKRHRPPGLRFEDLPPIDVVLISHDHYDHMDIPTLRRIQVAHRPRFVAGLGQAALLASFGIHNVTQLDWWEWTRVSGLRIWGVPARHDCRRGGCDADTRLWLGFVLRSPAGDVYFAGDTGYGPHFQQIVDRFGPPRLALLPIAPGLPRALFAKVHLDAHDAVVAAEALRARTSIPIHFGTFAQGDEGDGEPESKLRAEAGPGWVVLHNGQSWATSSPAAGGS